MIERKATVRYSDAELAEFQQLIETKLEVTQRQLTQLTNQIIESTENNGDAHGVDYVDDSNFNNNLEMLNNMAIRQRKYVRDLNNALIRIQNKVYGVCVITGELIDKKRLMAVPTTTKSLAAKRMNQKARLKKSRNFRLPNNPYVREGSNPKVISRIISKSKSNTQKSNTVVSEDGDLLDQFNLPDDQLLKSKEVDFKKMEENKD